MKPQSKRNTTRWALGTLLVAGILLFGFTVQWFCEERPQSVDIDDRAEKTTSRSPRHTHGRSSPSTYTSVQDQRVPSKLAEEIPPWQATPNETSPLPPGTVPAWRVAPPPPDPSTRLPPPPVEPPNPAEHRPPIHNPGGVDRDRPTRSVPGLE